MKTKNIKKSKKYIIEVDENQLSTLIAATEVFSRIGTGQFWAAWDYLPWGEIEDYSAWHENKDRIGRLISRFTKSNVDGSHSSLGIHNPQVESAHKIAWDLYQLFRHRLSWDNAIEKGYIKDDKSPRNWDKMMGVSYDEPLNSSGFPLAKIKKKIQQPKKKIDISWKEMRDRCS